MTPSQIRFSTIKDACFFSKKVRFKIHKFQSQADNLDESDFGDDVREMMASRDIEKMQFPVLDMLRNEQKEKKNVSVEKDDFSEVVKEDSKKKTELRFIRGHFLIEILIFDYISSTCFEKVTANFESFLIIKRFHR